MRNKKGYHIGMLVELPDGKVQLMSKINETTDQEKWKVTYFDRPGVYEVELEKEKARV